jgi:hypothetical protein
MTVFLAIATKIPNARPEYGDVLILRAEREV